MVREQRINFTGELPLFVPPAPLFPSQFWGKAHDDDDDDDLRPVLRRGNLSRYLEFAPLEREKKTNIINYPSKRSKAGGKKRKRVSPGIHDEVLSLCFRVQQ